MLQRRTAFSEQGIILAALLDSRSTAAPLDRLSDNFARRCDAQLTELQRLTPAARRAFIASLTQELFSPIPAHLNRVHPSWVQHLLSEEPPAIVAVVLQGLPAALASGLSLPPLPEPAPDPSPQIRRQVYQLVLGRLEAMPEEAEGEPRALGAWAELATWSPARVGKALLQLGCLILGALIKKGPPDQGELLLTRFSPFAEQITAATVKPIALPRTIHPSTDHQDPQQVLMLLGLQSAGPCIPEPCRRQVAQLLPRSEGNCLMEETAEDHRHHATMLTSLGQADVQARRSPPEALESTAAGALS